MSRVGEGEPGWDFEGVATSLKAIPALPDYGNYRFLMGQAPPHIRESGAYVIPELTLAPERGIAQFVTGTTALKVENVVVVQPMRRGLQIITETDSLKTTIMIYPDARIRFRQTPRKAV